MGIYGRIHNRSGEASKSNHYDCSFLISEKEIIKNDEGIRTNNPMWSYLK